MAVVVVILICAPAAAILLSNFACLAICLSLGSDCSNCSAAAQLQYLVASASLSFSPGASGCISGASLQPGPFLRLSASPQFSTSTDFQDWIFQLVKEIVMGHSVVSELNRDPDTTLSISFEKFA